MRRPDRRTLVLLAAALLSAALALPWAIAPLLASGVRAEAARRGLRASVTHTRFAWPATVELTGLTLVRTNDDTLLTANRLEAALAPRWGSWRPRVAHLELETAHLRLSAVRDDAETDDRDTGGDAPSAGPAAPRVRAAAAQWVDALLLPARRLPELLVTSLRVDRGGERFATLEALTLTHERGGLQLAATGAIGDEEAMPVSLALQWDRDDHLSGRFGVRVREQGVERALDAVVEGRVTQDRRAGVLRVAEGTHVSAGDIDLRLSGEVRRAGPRFALAAEFDSLTAREVQRTLPQTLLGPLAHLPVSGSWDWHASLDVDVSDPDRTRFTADVVPHGLALAGADGVLRLYRLAEPFVAEVHVHDTVVLRDLSSANPHFRPLERISPLLQHALLTNEDGAFFRHRGFNTEAIQLAMAANLRAGSFRRGAGTVTMQLARNLFLGHRRTLARKGQEVVLAWVLEHLTGLPKERLLEIYLNIIEWGPGVHGADEAARFYFDRDAADLTLDEALFLTIVVPSPMRWRSRLDETGALRPWAREQMAFIARRMADHGWLDPASVPTAEALQVTLRGPAATAFAPSADSLEAPTQP